MVSVMLYPCISCVLLLMDQFVLCVTCFTVFVNSLLNQLAVFFGVVVILLLNWMNWMLPNNGTVKVKFFLSDLASFYRI